MKDDYFTYSMTFRNRFYFHNNKRVINTKTSYSIMLIRTRQTTINRRIDNIILTKNFNNYIQSYLSKNNNSNIAFVYRLFNKRDDQKNEVNTISYVKIKKSYDENEERSIVENYYKFKNLQLMKAIYG